LKFGKGGQVIEMEFRIIIMFRLIDAVPLLIELDMQCFTPYSEDL